MAKQTSIDFIDAALYCSSSPFALSYTDPNQRWLIKEHLRSLVQDFPSLKPSTDTWTHNDGTQVNLFIACGNLRVSTSSPLVPLIIWIHENYPIHAPIVYVSTNPKFPIYENHPFVDSSGATTSSYLENWLYPGCTLSDLVRNLVKLFAHNHPFYFSSPSPSSRTHPSLLSRREATDRLVCSVHYDVIALRSATEEEIEVLTAAQAEMARRAGVLEDWKLELEHEWGNLKERVKKWDEERDKILSWLRVHDQSSVFIDDVFGAIDEKSEKLLDCKANDLAIEDLFYKLDEALQEGVLTLEMYMKEVRKLAREQFFCRHRERQLSKT